MEVASLRLLLMGLAGWWNNQRQEAMAYLIEETGSSERSCVNDDSV